MTCIRFFFATIAIALSLHTVSAAESVSRKQLDVMVGNSDEYAETIVSIHPPQVPAGFGYDEHAKITSVLDTVRETIATARELMENEETHQAGTEMMDAANTAYREVTGHIAERKLHTQQTEEDEERGMNVARQVYEIVSLRAAGVEFTNNPYLFPNTSLVRPFHSRQSLFPSVSICSLLIALPSSRARSPRLALPLLRLLFTKSETLLSPTNWLIRS
jgi:hypothetical protein